MTVGGGYEAAVDGGGGGYRLLGFCKVGAINGGGEGLNNL